MPLSFFFGARRFLVFLALGTERFLTGDGEELEPEDFEEDEALDSANAPSTSTGTSSRAAGTALPTPSSDDANSSSGFFPT